MKRTTTNGSIHLLKRSTVSLSLFLLAVTTVPTTAQMGGGLMEPEDELKLTSHFQLEENTRTGYLILTAKIPEGSYIYSLTQKDTPPPSKIEIATSESFEVSGTFQPEHPPTVTEVDPDFGGRTEKHKKSLRFFIPLKLSESTTPGELTIRLRFNGQVCSDQGTCLPIRDKIVEATFSGYFQKVADRTQNSGHVHR